MIKTKEGAASVEGNSDELLADLATVVRTVKETLMEAEKEEFVKKQIGLAVKIGLMNEEEFNKTINEPVSTFINELLGGIFDEDK